MSGLSRRRFLAGTATAFAAPFVFADDKPMPRRALGKTGLAVSAVGLGCAQLGQYSVSEADAARIVGRALEVGVTYIDTAEQYGLSEKRVGKALAGQRDRVVLATKTRGRTKAAAERHLAQSLKDLKTDRIDLWQFHSLKDTSDLDAICAKDGALAAGLAAQKAGQVRFLGVTGHYVPEVFVEALRRHPFDAVLVPVNAADVHHRSFTKSVLPAAKKGGAGAVGMKVFCAGALPKKKILGAEACLRYALATSVATCIVGCADRKEIEFAAHVARTTTPMTADERRAAEAETKAHAGTVERYKRR